MPKVKVEAKVDLNLEKEVEQILSNLGLTIPQAIEMYLYQIQLRRGIPFEIKITNTTTPNTFTDQNLNKYTCYLDPDDEV